MGELRGGVEKVGRMNRFGVAGGTGAEDEDAVEGGVREVGMLAACAARSSLCLLRPSLSIAVGSTRGWGIRLELGLLERDEDLEGRFLGGILTYTPPPVGSRNDSPSGSSNDPIHYQPPNYTNTY